MQLKRFDLSNYPDSVKIKYPFKPQTGVNHQSSSFNGYNKFHRSNNGLGGGGGKTWQTNGGNGCRPTVHSTLHVTRSAPPAVAPPLFSPYNSIWSPQSASSTSSPFGCNSLPSDSLCSGGPSDLNEYNCLESLCSQIAECALAAVIGM
eukprot:sb/3473714/